MSNLNNEDIARLLRSKNLRVTPQRYAVYANLLRRCDHPAVDQILSDLNRDIPISSQATVYSSLQALRKAGLVREVLLDEGVCRYDAKVEPHHHFRCRRCGRIEDVAWSLLPDLNLEPLRSGLHAEDYEVTIRGLCERCQT